MLRSIALLFVLAFAPTVSLAQGIDWRESAQTAVHMLDYVGVDYPEFVQNGKVVNEEEYQEQLEFARQVMGLLQELPEHLQRAQLLADAERLAQLVAVKAPGPQVSAASGELRRAIVAAYDLAVAPKQPPDPGKGAALYAQLCVACHGAEGRGDGPAGQGLEPPPSDFHDDARMNSRSVYGLYNTITLGVGGTGMAAYKQLSEAQRWALAFFVSRFPISDIELVQGQAAWESGAHNRTFSDLRDVVARSTEEVRDRHGRDAARAHLWLRTQPQALAQGRPSPIQFSIDTLRQSFAAYSSGERAQARTLAITAYLEGFELVEASLDNVDPGLRFGIEREMIVHRNLLKSGASVDAVRAQTERIVGMLNTAQIKLDSEGLSPTATFTASFLILLREGLEAILVLAAIITFLIKSGRRDALPWVHIGWGAALALGTATWFVASYVFTISGANREVTEGVTALIAAAVLLYVGLWLHSKAHSQTWQRFINGRVGAALGKRTLWALAAVSFLAVYRELFEIVLFYQALWAQTTGAGAPVFGGIAVAAAALAVIGWAVFRYGLRLPIGPFFTVSSILLAVLAVIFAGQGVAALQEAGYIGADPVTFVRAPAFGVFPTVQTLVAQALVIVLIAVGFYLLGRAARDGRPS